jgi:sulfatase modifying factor 1
MNPTLPTSPAARPPKSIARLVAGVVSVMTAAAGIYGLFKDPKIALLAFIGMIFAVVLLLLINHASKVVEDAGKALDQQTRQARQKRAQFWELLIRVLAVFVLGYFMILAVLLLPQVPGLFKSNGHPIETVVTLATTRRDCDCIVDVQAKDLDPALVGRWRVGASPVCALDSKGNCDPYWVETSTDGHHVLRRANGRRGCPSQARFPLGDQPILPSAYGAATEPLQKASVTVGRSRFELVRTPESSIQLGDPDVNLAEPFERRLSTVTHIPETYMMITEVTRGLWLDVMPVDFRDYRRDPERTLCSRRSKDCPECGDPPTDRSVAAYCMSWFDAVTFANELSARCGLEQAYVLKPGNTAAEPEVTWDRTKSGFRLPTEAEWENAARAERDTPFSGSSDITLVAWSGNDAPPVITRETCLLAPNRWGLFDMTGNQWEWVWDKYSEQIDSPEEGRNTRYRMARGGAWWTTGLDLRVYDRKWYKPSERYGGMGFRLTLTPGSTDVTNLVCTR